MTRYPYAKAMGVAAGALLIGAVITKDTGLLHGTLDPATLYCSNYETWLNNPDAVQVTEDGHIVDAPPVRFNDDEREQCKDDFRDLDLDDQREILRNIMGDDG